MCSPFDPFVQKGPPRVDVKYPDGLDTGLDLGLDLGLSGGTLSGSSGGSVRGCGGYLGTLGLRTLAIGFLSACRVRLCCKAGASLVGSGRRGSTGFGHPV